MAYGGFFQSERYFADYEDDVRRMFRVRDEHRREFEHRFPGLRPYVCVHVRRADYLETRGWALPTQFYLDALAAVPDRERYEVIVVSDDADAVRDELREIPEARVEANPAIIDFQLMTNADVLITSASSFSWWGGWLNESGLVLAPRHWVGFEKGVEIPRDVIPERWTQVPVRDEPLMATWAGPLRRARPTS